MAVDYQRCVFPYRRVPDQDAATPARHPVIVAGAGPVGLSLAIDLAQQGVPVVLVDDDDRLATGSRCIVVAKRTLDIFDRLGCGDPMVAKGISWSVGKVFQGDDIVYRFDLSSEGSQHRPPFINLQQYYMEGFLVERAQHLPLIDVRWKHAVVDVEQCPGEVVVTLDTPEGRYRVVSDYLVACDGSRSTIRQRLGLAFRGQQFDDRFLIADVKMKASFPTERWFWFDAPFHRHQNVLLHRQPDDVWRVDFQLGPDADPDEERKPERIIPRVRALLGADTAFELEWASVYTFRSGRIDSFRHDRILFAGDAAHCVSPFGARGANSGVQDAENLAWKLAFVLRGCAGSALLDSYDEERAYAADENIRYSTRSTNFIAPPTEMSRVFRDAVLGLAAQYPFARSLVNTGRLSTPTVLRESSLNTPDGDAFTASLVLGAVAFDAPVMTAAGPGWLLPQLEGGTFTLLVSDGPEIAFHARAAQRAAEAIAPIRVILVARGSCRGEPSRRTGDAATAGPSTTQVIDASGAVAACYDLAPGTTYLLRPDQHVCARWRRPEPEKITCALRRALALR